MIDGERRKTILSSGMLGRVPDRLVAEKFGCSIFFVFKLRCKLRIPASQSRYANGYKRKIDLVTLKTKAVPKLGYLSDAEVGRLFGVTRERIRQLRAIFSIPRAPRRRAA